MAATAERTAAALGRWRAALAAGLAGCGCMAAELSAVRLLAPHFGDSAYVWTNVIGVILAALAGGAWCGGWLAGRGDAARAAARLAAAAGVWMAASPWLASSLGGWLLPADVPLDAAMTAMIRGSFVATALLFGPAMVAIGALSPLLVTACVRAGSDVGRAAGAVGASGTIGSLLGTFAATHALVPLLGCRMAMGTAGALLVVAALVVRGVRPGAAHAAALLAVAAITALHDGSLRRALPGQELLAEVESRMQFLQVVRERSGDVERTTLRINEGLDSHHSLAITGTPFTGGAYYDWHALAPLLVGDGTPPRDLRVLSIGDAAGTLRTVYAAVHPGVPVDAVDVDPATMALGDRWFPGPKAAGERFVLDGRVFLAAAAARWHVIHVDAYAHQVYVPAHLASVEFFRTARERLHEGGLLACNVGALQPTDPVLLAIGASMKAVFGHARALLLPNTRNALLVARRGDEPRPERLAAAGSDGANLTAADRAHWQRLLATASASPWFDVGNGASPLVDDRPLLDRLLARSYVDTRDTGERVECRGDVDVPGAEIAAFGARQRRDWSALLDAVRSSRAESALLREYAGDARWSLRELRSAAAEYERAAGLAADEPTRARLRGNLAYLADELGPVQRAEASARRNGWLQWLLVGAAAVTVAVVWRASARSSSPAVVG